MSKVASTAADDNSPQSKTSSILVSTSAQISYQLHPRRNRHSWFFIRFFLGIFGAGLVVLPLALPESWIAAIFGLVLFLTAILLPSSLKSHEEGELALGENEAVPEAPRKIVLEGADFCSASAPPVRVQIFVSEEQILAMKPNLQPAVVIPTIEISSVFLQRVENSWLLFLEWPGNETVFSFRGFFGERNARKAEAAICNFIRTSPPEKPKVRAAGA